MQNASSNLTFKGFKMYIGLQHFRVKMYTESVLQISISVEIEDMGLSNSDSKIMASQETNQSLG